MVTLQNHKQVLETMEKWEPILDGLAFAGIGYLLYKQVKKLTGKEALCFSAAQWGMIQLAKWKYPAGEKNNPPFDINHTRALAVVALASILFMAFSVSAKKLKGTRYFPKSTLVLGTLYYYSFKSISVLAMKLIYSYPLNIKNADELNGVPSVTVKRVYNHLVRRWEDVDPTIQLRIRRLLPGGDSKILPCMMSNQITATWIDGLSQDDFKCYFNSYSGLNLETIESYKERQPCSDSEVLDAVCTRAAQDELLTKERYKDHPCYKVASATVQEKTRVHFENG